MHRRAFCAAALCLAADGGRLVAPVRTPVPRHEMRRLFLDYMPREVVEMLLAHWALETADGRRMFNFNVAGLRGLSPARDGVRLVTHEYVDGERKKVRATFRAYASARLGVEDYLRLMVDKYEPALIAAYQGDVYEFAKQLHEGGYYTASVKAYARGLRRYFGRES